MSIKVIVAAGVLLASTSAFAQGAPKEQTSEDLVCQLAELCETAQATEEAAVETTPTVPGGRVSATRGFRIATKPSGSASTSTSAATTGARPKANVATTATKRPTGSPGKGYVAPRPVPNAASGRADLQVSFVTGSAELTEVGQREAMKFAEALKSPLLAGMRFRIEGHTDAVGNREYNLDLSKRRAQSVVDYLAGKGADRSRFDVAGFGFDQPLAGTSPNAAANRRVEVVRIRK